MSRVPNERNGVIKRTSKGTTNMIPGSGGILVHFRRRDLPGPRIEYCAGDFSGFVAHESKTSVVVVFDKELAV